MAINKARKGDRKCGQEKLIIEYSENASLRKMTIEQRPLIGEKKSHTSVWYKNIPAEKTSMQNLSFV